MLSWKNPLQEKEARSETTSKCWKICRRRNELRAALPSSIKKRRSRADLGRHGESSSGRKSIIKNEIIRICGKRGSASIRGFVVPLPSGPPQRPSRCSAGNRSHDADSSESKKPEWCSRPFVGSYRLESSVANRVVGLRKFPGRQCRSKARSNPSQANLP